jgi:hypothetical protein
VSYLYRCCSIAFHCPTSASESYHAFSVTEFHAGASMAMRKRIQEACYAHLFNI